MPREVSETYYPLPDAIMSNEKYFVCRLNGNIERVIQSDLNPDRAQYSVDVFNEHEANNNRKPTYYWRQREAHETDDEVRRNRRTRDARRHFEKYTSDREVLSYIPRPTPIRRSQGG